MKQTKRIKKRLGDLLVDAGVITAEQLRQALQEQRTSGQRLGRALISLGFVTEEDILNVLEVQLGLAQVELYKQLLPADLIQLVPDNLVRRHMVVPVSRFGNLLKVAMVDPLNVVALDDLALATGCEIEPVITTEADIDRAIQKYYGLQDLVHKAFQDMETPGPEWDETTMVVDILPEGGADQAPVVRIINSVIQQAVIQRASDIHLEPHQEAVRVRFRVDGVLRDVSNLPRRSLAALVSRIKIMGGMDIAEKRLPQDGRVQVKVGSREVDLRVSSLPTVFGEKVVLRLLDRSAALLRLDQLGFARQEIERYYQLIRLPYGMVLVTGPTGSGKTTTLYATLNEINHPERNIITIEDPVEYVLEGINQVQVNPKAGLDFAAGLRSVLRQDPDIIMVGEIRDGETADIAVRAATTGHMVFSTLHTNDAAGALNRLIDMGVEPFLVASSVSGVIAQRLVRRICPNCREEYQVELGAVERDFLKIGRDEPQVLFRGRGCRECDNSGYQGRVGIYEVLSITAEQRELINRKAPSGEVTRLALQQGMASMKEDGLGKARQGLTTLDEVMRVAF